MISWNFTNNDKIVFHFEGEGEDYQSFYLGVEEAKKVLATLSANIPVLEARIKASRSAELEGARKSLAFYKAKIEEIEKEMNL